MVSYKIINLYIHIRNIEERYPFTDVQMKNYYNTALRLKLQSTNQMLDYIDDRFKSQYTYKNGSLTSTIKNNRKKFFSLFTNYIPVRWPKIFIRQFNFFSIIFP